MRNHEKNIENIMMEWRDDNDGIEDYGRMIKNLGNQIKMRDYSKKREQL